MSRAQKIRSTLAICIMFLSAGVVVYLCLANTKSRNVLKVSFLDVGQGDAIFIESPSGVQMLVDAGPDKIVLNKLSEVMAFYDRNIDIVLATHPDKDHIGGIPSILKKYKVDMLIESGATNDNGLYEQTQSLANILEKEGKLIRVQAYAGQSINMGDGVKVDILYPDRAVSDVATNDASIVCLLTYGSKTFLLTGDSAFETEYRLLRNKGLGKVNVLKVGHHGSQYSTGSIFLDRIRPDYAVITSGKNTYGHPSVVVLDILKKFNAIALRTDESGSIVFETNGQNISYGTAR